jgi:5'-nucleotidase
MSLPKVVLLGLLGVTLFATLGNGQKMMMMGKTKSKGKGKGGYWYPAYDQPPSLKIILANDDGFETDLIQNLFLALTQAGHNVVMSAPYGARSGTSGTIEFLRPYGLTAESSPGGTLPAGSPGVGPTTLADQQYYVDGAVTSAVLYGLDVLANRYFGGPPDLVLMGPNEGQNVGLLTPHSGTVGGAVTAINRGIPTLAISADGNETQPRLVADLMVKLIESLYSTKYGKIIIPSGLGLNVNFPLLSTDFTHVDDYTFVPTKVGVAVNSVGLQFFEKLSDCPSAVAFGLGEVDLPGLCFAVPYTDAGYPEDSDPMSEGNVIQNGKRQIAVRFILSTRNYMRMDGRVPYLLHRFAFFTRFPSLKGRTRHPTKKRTTCWMISK